MKRSLFEPGDPLALTAQLPRRPGYRGKADYDTLADGTRVSPDERRGIRAREQARQQGITLDALIDALQDRLTDAFPRVGIYSPRYDTYRVAQQINRKLDGLREAEGFPTKERVRILCRGIPELDMDMREKRPIIEFKRKLDALYDEAMASLGRGGRSVG